MCLRYFKEAGIYLYASTKAILEEALKTLGYDQVPYEQIQVCDGEILMIDGKGKIERAYFTPPVNINSLPIYTCWEPIVEAPSAYRKSLMDYGIGIGVPKQELEWLHYAGYTTYDLEEAIYNKNYRIMCLWESGYYDEMEDTLYEINYDGFKSYAWA